MSACSNCGVPLIRNPADGAFWPCSACGAVAAVARFCVGCRHYRAPVDCDHRAALRPSFITGIEKWWTAGAFRMVSSAGFCGPDGRYWEAKAK